MYDCMRRITASPYPPYRAVNTPKEGTEYLPVNHGVESFQRVACFREAGVTVLKIKKAVLHRSNVVRRLYLF